jgi:hypothetical protein
LLADVTKGGNSYCDATSCTPPKSTMDCKGTTVCNAAAGYDGPSGVGTPIGLGAFIPLSVAIRPPGVLTQTSATLKGIVDPHFQTVNECGFEYKQSGKSHVVVCKLGPGSGDSPVEVSAKITGLTPNTAASYRVLAGFYGPIASPEVGFTTAKIAADGRNERLRRRRRNQSWGEFGDFIRECQPPWRHAQHIGSSAKCANSAPHLSAPLPSAPCIPPRYEFR